jgi:hypothetical protein
MVAEGTSVMKRDGYMQKKEVGEQWKMKNKGYVSSNGMISVACVQQCYESRASMALKCVQIAVVCMRIGANGEVNKINRSARYVWYDGNNI